MEGENNQREIVKWGCGGGDVEEKEGTRASLGKEIEAKE